MSSMMLPTKVGPGLEYRRGGKVSIAVRSLLTGFERLGISYASSIHCPLHVCQFAKQRNFILRILLKSSLESKKSLKYFSQR